MLKTFPLRFVLINPCIHDFAAMNLWSRPLGLLRVAEYLSQYDIDVKLIDCMDTPDPGGSSGRLKKYGVSNYPRQIIAKPDILKPVPRRFARYGMNPHDMKKALCECLPFDCVCITSLMSYWYPGVQEAIGIAKEVSPGTTVLLGGIYATLFPAHASEKSGADLVYRGHIGDDIVSVLKERGYFLQKVTPPAPYYRTGFYRHHPFSPLLTAYGCPYHCSYCASKILFQGFSQKDPSEVFHEIKDLYDSGTRDFVFYDDALLVNADEHIKVLLKKIIASGMTVRFHCPNGLHARHIDDETCYLMKRSGFITLRLGFETVNDTRQKVTGGKVSTDILSAAIDTLKDNGFAKEHIGVYLMFGLPGQTLAEVEEGVRFLKRSGVMIFLTEFSPIPGTSCWDELKQTGLIDDSTDPLLTNNTVFSYLFSGYDHKAMEDLKLEVKMYNNAAYHTE